MGFLGKTNTSLANKATPFSMADALPVQTKLTVSKASDAAEKEADAVAHRVVNEQKDKKATSKKTDDKKDAQPAPKTEPTPEPKKEGVKTKTDDKKNVQKAGNEKEEKKATKKEDNKKENLSRQQDKKQEVHKKTEQKDEKKPAKKSDDDKKDKVSKKDDKKQEVQKKSEEKEKKKVDKKDDNNKDKKPVDHEKDLNAKPKQINRREANPSKPIIQQKPKSATQTTALGRKEGGNALGKEQDNDAENDEAKLKAVEDKINAKKGSGKPLHEQVRSEMEQSFKHDFSEVKIHDDKESAELCAALSAHAFAIGNDIFFNTGKYDPDSDNGKELLAHELTHVVQQKDEVQRAVVYRKKSSGQPKGTLEKGKITLPKLELPKLKGRNKPKIGNSVERTKNYDRDKAMKDEKSQTDVWKQDADITSSVTNQIEKLKEKAGTKPSKPDVYYLKWESIKLFGTEKQLIANSKVPLWNKDGKVSAYDVDHIKELQLQGTNEIGNMELLNFSANRGSGSVIDKKIRDAVNTFITDDATKEKYGDDVPKDVEKALKNNVIAFESLSFTEVIAGPKDNDYWSFNDIKQGKHLKEFKKMSKNEIEDVAGSEDDPIAYTSSVGGAQLKNSKLSRLPGFKGNIKLKKGQSGDTAGTLDGKFSPNQKIFEPMDLSIDLFRMDGVDFGGYIKRRAEGGNLESILSNLKVKGLSPVQVNGVELLPDNGFIVSGTIMPTVQILGSGGIDFVIRGEDIELSKTFYAGEINMPPPLKINDASLTVFAGTKGVGVKGNVDFEITKVGKGQISASGGSSGVFKLDGNFEFDEKLFGGVKANVKAGYEHTENGEDKWDLHGNIHIPKGKIRGIESAEINVNYADKIFKADGSAKFDVPGLEDGKMSVTYGNDQLIIEGEANFKHKFIKSGKVSAKVETAGDQTKVSMAGNAVPNIPGIDSELSVSYIDGVFLVTGTVGYSKGRLSGNATVGVTNQAVSADGKPSGKPGNDLKVFGSASLTLKITDWLQGTAGVTFKPDGQIDVVGKIGIPQAVDIFAKKEIKKDIFKAPTIEIPLFAIPVGSHSIGLVATIGGGAEAYASIGPGQLTDAAVEVKYNPAQEESMAITGNAKFRVPAEAGLRLYVRAGIGLSVGIARVSGGLELSGALGIAGAAEAAVAVNWTPTQGFKLDAEASLFVQPKFKFDVNAYVEAVLDLWITEFSKEWKWNLYSFEWGPALKFGVKFPVHYEENKPFDISLDQVQFEAPDIDVGTFAKGVGQQLLN